MTRRLSRRCSRPEGSSEPSGESLRFYQRRVALFGLVGAILGLAFFAFNALDALRRETDWLPRAMFRFHLLGILISASMWLACRRGQRSLTYVKAVEGVGFVGACLAYEAMALAIPLVARPDLIAIFVLSIVLMARAVYVPSTPSRTLVLGVLAGIPLPVGAYVLFRGIDPALFAQLARAFEVTRPEELAIQGAAGIGFSWLMMVLLATGTSNVIYGLRREAREARRLGQYTLERKLGEGGMGEVYRASHAMLRRPTAVKLLPPDRMGETGLARFEREVQLTARLSHPNTVTIFDYGRTPDGVFYYAMELLDGASLDAVVGVAGALAPERVAHVLHQVLGALAEAHEVGLIHRDIKPANIILCRQGGIDDFAKVVDFGLVKELDQSGDVRLTHGDVITGTPLYLSPEAITAPESMGAASDLYSLGAVGYFALTGQHVFEGRSLVEVCSHHLHTAPEPPSRRLGAALPEDLESLILACLQKDPGRRPSSATELRRRLEACACLGRWTQDRARAWWREHAGAAARREPGAEHTPVTLTRRFDSPLS